MEEKIIEMIIEREVRTYVFSHKHNVERVIIHELFPKPKDTNLDLGDTLFISAKGNIDILYDNYYYQEVKTHEYCINQMKILYNDVTHQFERIDSIVEPIIILDYPPQVPI